MVKYIKFLKKEFLLAGHIMSLGGALLTLTLLLILEKQVSFSLILSIYLFVQPIFWIDRYIGFRGDLEANKERSDHLSSYFKYIPFISLAYVITFVYVSWFHVSNQNFILGVVLLIMGCLYALVFKKITRYVLGFKNFFVATFYVFFLIYGLIYSNQSIFTIPIALLATFVFIRSLYIQIFFDFKDIKDDAQNKLKTFPVVLGSYKTIKILNVLNFLSIAPILIALFLYQLPLWSLTISVPFITYMYALRGLKNKPELKWFLLVGFEYILIGLVGLIVLII
ncbi:MAG: hypothetical protein KatS3mg085_519 [Candidatus Dojkabacteria bacterium]|nr:MAG: hypothetical protein KatS3mg085_519 [Candidatus Dojkabacteria bacterium]